MNGFSDSITIGIVITLVFGALFFYLYSRQVQNEKRVSLIENILLDLKMAADANQSWGSANWGLDSNEEKAVTEERSVAEPPVERVEAVSAPQPFVDDDVDEKQEEESFKEIFGNVTSDESPVKSFDIAMGKNGDSRQVAQVNVTKVQPNYAAMSTKELKALAKQRGLNFPSGAGKREITDALRKQDTLGSSAPEAGSLLGSQEGASLLEEETETL